MAGVKGRSGGKRPGAGRKPSAPSPEVPIPHKYTAREYLQAVVDGLEPADAHRIAAARALLPHDEPKATGKQKADKGSTPRFKAAAAPKLVVNNS